MPPFPPRVLAGRMAACVALAGATVGWASAAIPPATEPAPKGVLDLREGGHLPGELMPAEQAGEAPRSSLLWKSPAFATPFEFRLDAVSGIRFAEPRDVRKPAAEPLRFHLRGGDVVAGTIAAVDAATVTVETSLGGDPQRLRIDRAELESIGRRGASGGSFDGPGGLAGWEQKPADAWREEAGRLLSSRRSASVSRDVAAPPRARYDLAVSWKTPAEFRFSLTADGVAGDDQFMLELLRPRGRTPMLAVVRRKGGRAALEPVAVNAEADSLRIVLFVDQLKGRMAVVLPGSGDAPAADIAVERSIDAEPLPGVRLSLLNGDLCLESLRVSPWTTAEPTLDDAERTTIAVRDGPTRTGDLEGFDPQAEAFLVREGDQAIRVPVADVSEIAFSRNAAAGPREPPQVRVIGVQGDAVSGGLVKVDRQGVWVRRQGIAEPVGVGYAHLVSLQSLVSSTLEADLQGREGRLEGDGFVVRGSLAAVDGDVGWQPVGATKPSRFAASPAFGGRLDYVVPTTADDTELVGGIGGMVSRADDGGFVVTMLAEDGAAARDGRLQPGDRIVAIAPSEKARFVQTKGLDADDVTDLLRGRIGTPVRVRVTTAAGNDAREIEIVRGRLGMAGGNLLRQALQTQAELAAPQSAAAELAYPEVVVLTSGESTVCRVAGIDAERLRLSTPLGGTVDVPTALVKAVELDPAAPGRAIDKVRFERLLTVPRSQRSRPPTHVVRLKNGDYVRGRLITVDDASVKLELPGSEQTFPRNAVTRVIWLHPEELDEKADGDAQPAVSPADGVSLLAVWPGGRRAGVTATGIDGTAIVGRNAALGEVRIDTEKVDRLIFGAMIDKDTAPRPYSQWKVRPAPEPRALREPQAEAVKSAP